MYRYSLTFLVLNQLHHIQCKRCLHCVWRFHHQLQYTKITGCARLPTCFLGNKVLKKQGKDTLFLPSQVARACSTNQIDGELSRLQKLALLALVAFAAVCSCIAFIVYEARQIHGLLRTTDNVFDAEKEYQYIYPKKKTKVQQETDVFKDLERKLKLKLQKTLSKVTPWLQGKPTDDPWVLLHLAESSDPDIRRIGLSALTEDHDWEDYQYRYIAQASKLSTQISLARMENADLKLFKRMPRLPPPKNCIEDEFRILLASLPKDNVQECVNHFTSKALMEGKVEEERGGLWCFGGTGLEFGKTISKAPEATVERFCLESLVFHSMIPGHCIEMVNLGALTLLQRVYMKHSSSVVFRRHIAWILGNLALNQNLHKNIIDGGWLPVLHNWLRSKDMALCLHAARALTNMDSDAQLCGNVRAFYEDGIYLTHPIYRQKENIYADVVLIHGLMGGPFKTWRQEDRRRTEPGFVVDDEVRETYTFCWPKDWLAKDCSNIRILNVGYDSELSEWNSKCPFETEKRSIAQRSAILIDKLQRADVGSRPLIWVGHSMGGLLIKQILQLADTDPRFEHMKRNTIGVLFYSTPHRGSSLAKYSNQAKYMLYPSVEVKELNEGNILLSLLHKSFLKIIEERNIPCLSFGETQKTPLGMKLEVTIVPPESSDPGIGEFHAMPTNHLNVCKPTNRDSELYKLTLNFINKCLFQQYANVVSFGEFLLRNNNIAFIVYEARQLHGLLRTTDNVFDAEKEYQYIYPKKKTKVKQEKMCLKICLERKLKLKLQKTLMFKDLERKLKLKLQKTLSKVTPWLQGKPTDDPWVLLHLAESSDQDIRRIGLSALTEDHDWEDYQYRYIAQASKLSTQISLARMENADLKLFKRMPRLPPPKNCIEDEFRILLASLPKDNVQECVNHFTSKALMEGKVEEEKGGLWCFGGTGLEFGKTISKAPEVTVERFCLESLVFHSMIPGHCIEMVNLGAQTLLQRVYMKHSSSVVFRRHIAWILGNLALNQNLHKNIIDGGWLPVLHNWLRSKDMALCLHAARALTNMDSDAQLCGNVRAFYEDGIYLTHPIYRQKENIYADVVLIHGLMGGPFKTWRQEDRRRTEPGFVVDDKVRETYTFCWPKDWLAKDCSNIRILNVGYDSELSEWNSKCPFETEKRSIAQRSAILIDKLQRADVGSRPIIWVGHSMGGLLIKQILQLADTDPRFEHMKRNTIGVLFYSTPHRGSSLAKYSNQAKYMLCPSVEVKELNEGNILLSLLHKSFLKIIEERNIPCLSFGETQKTPLGMKLEVTIVPPESSDPGIGEFHAMPTNHLNVCKPTNRDSELYKLTLNFINKCLFQQYANVVSFGEFLLRNNK